MAEWKRDAQTSVSTMDQAHIRGLVTAVHLSVAGLPRFWIGDRPIARPLKNHEDSPHRAWHRVTDPAVVSMCCKRVLLIAWFQERAGFSTGGCQRTSIAGGRPAVGNPCSRRGSRWNQHQAGTHNRTQAVARGRELGLL